MNIIRPSSYALRASSIALITTLCIVVSHATPTGSAQRPSIKAAKKLRNATTEEQTTRQRPEKSKRQTTNGICSNRIASICDNYSNTSHDKCVKYYEFDVMDGKNYKCEYNGNTCIKQGSSCN